MSEAQFIKPPNNLRKAKIGSGPGKMDPNLIAKAEEAMAELEDDYMGWAQEDLKNLEAVLNKLQDGSPADDQAANLRRLFAIALDIKGQGSSFGYRMITAVADSLTDFIENREGKVLRELDMNVFDAHVNAMRAIFNEEVRDDGGPTGQLLMDALFKLRQKAAT